MCPSRRLRQPTVSYAGQLCVYSNAVSWLMCDRVGSSLQTVRSSSILSSGRSVLRRRVIGMPEAEMTAEAAHDVPADADECEQDDPNRNINEVPFRLANNSASGDLSAIIGRRLRTAAAAKAGNATTRRDRAVLG